MNTGFELQLVQTQKLVMTPELRQAIQLLQYSNLELLDFIKKEVEDNPVLEDIEIDSNRILKIEQIAEIYNARKHEFSLQNEQRDQNIEPVLIEQLSESEAGCNLRDYLLEQLRLSEYDLKEYQIIEYLINNVDESGYLFIDSDFICYQFHISKEELEKSVEKLQEFEPKGVGARSLKECLLLQLDEADMDYEDMKILIQEHLEHIATIQYDLMEKALNISQKQLLRLIERLKSLHPKPGSGFGESRCSKNTYVIPELNLEVKEDGFFVSFLNEYVPLMKINGYYLELLSKKELDEGTKEYLMRYLRRAEHIIRCIEQRKKTILSVAEYLVNMQQSFLLGKSELLKPLTLKDVSFALNIHESTVSRAVDGKYLQTQKGVIGLRGLLQKPVNAEGGYTAEHCMEEIKKIIDVEDKKKPFSDLQISELLIGKGIDISRRTVAKYREAVNIASSSKRKNKKR